MISLYLVAAVLIGFAVGLWVRAGEVRDLKVEVAKLGAHTVSLTSELSSWKRSFYDLEKVLEDAHLLESRAAKVMRFTVTKTTDDGSPPEAA